jgi:streptogramin lyase
MFRIGLIVLVAGTVLAACAGQPALTAEVTQPTRDATGLVQPTATAALAATVSPGSSGVEPTASATRIPAAPRLQEYPLPAGSHPHDIAPAADGTVAKHLRSSHFPAAAQPYGSF